MLPVSFLMAVLDLDQKRAWELSLPAGNTNTALRRIVLSWGILQRFPVLRLVIVRIRVGCARELYDWSRSASASSDIGANTTSKAPIRRDASECFRSRTNPRRA